MFSLGPNQLKEQNIPNPLAPDNNSEDGNIDFELLEEEKANKAYIPSLPEKKHIPKFNNEPFKKQFSVYYLEKENLPSKEGWMLKKSPIMIKGWGARFCKVKERKFIYYKKKDLDNPNGYIDFDLVSVELVEKRGKDGNILYFRY